MERGTGLANIQDFVNMEEPSRPGLSRYNDTSKEELMKATKEETVLTDWNDDTDSQLKRMIRREYQDKRITKSLRGQFLRQT